MPINAANVQVLIVDDDPITRQFMSMEFRIFGFNPIEATSGQNAISVLEQNKIDVIVSDIKMPNGDGFYLLNEVKKRNVDTPPIFFMTAEKNMDLRNSYHLGVDGFFNKPISAREILTTIRNSLLPLTTRLSLVPSGARPPQATLTADRALTEKIEIQFGRRGVSLSWSSTPTQNDEPVEFCFAHAMGEIKGKGFLRWKTPTQGAFPVRIGIEFTYLEKDSRRIFVDWMKTQTGLVPSIPA